MDGFRGRERSTPAQSARAGKTRYWAVRLEQTKPVLEVALRPLFVWGVFVGMVRVVPCGRVMARAEKEKRAMPKNGRWRSICIAKEWWLGERAYWLLSQAMNDALIAGKIFPGIFIKEASKPPET